MPQENIWYPDKEFVVKVHDRMLEKFGGFQGFERGLKIFDFILEKLKQQKESIEKPPSYCED